MISMRFPGEWKWPLVIVGISFLLSILERAWRAHKQRRSQTWPVSHGQITKAAVHQAKHESILTLWYSYLVPNEPYPVPAEFQKEFYSVDEARKWADALSNATVPVRFDPANPWKSQLSESDLATIVQAAVPDQ
jgi:hypothetical protein